MDRQFPDFFDSLEWNLVARVGLQAQQIDAKSYQPIPRQTYVIQNSSVLIIGVKSATAQPNWVTGGWASQVIPFSPSSTSSFIAATRTEQKRLKLDSLNLTVFPKLSDVWFLEVATPHWFMSTFLEIWRYDGQDLDQFVKFEQVSADLLHLTQLIPPSQ